MIYLSHLLTVSLIEFSTERDEILAILPWRHLAASIKMRKRA